MPYGTPDPSETPPSSVFVHDLQGVPLAADALGAA